MNRTKRTDAKRMKHPNSSSPSNRLQKFLVAVPVAGVGLGAATSSNAAIVNFDLTGHAGGGLILAGNTSSYISFNFGDGTYAFAPGKPSSPLYLRNVPTYGGGNVLLTKQWVGNFSLLAGAGYNGLMINELALGATIGAGSGTWKSGAGYGQSMTGVAWNSGYQSWTAGTTGYMGLRLDLGGGNYDYGWAKLDYKPDGSTMKFTDFAFETTPNTSLLAGVTEVPEPKTSALILLAAGALGTAAYRRRKAVAA